jgi:hypothetical protein
VYWKGLEPSELLEYVSHLVAESILWCINPRELEGFDYSAQLRSLEARTIQDRLLSEEEHRRAATMTSTTWLAPQLRLLQQISNANDNLNNLSRLETSHGRVLNYSVTSSTRSTTS